MEPRHSGIGIASFIISLGTGFLLLVVFAILGIMETQTPGGVDEEAPATIVLGLMLFGGFFLELLAAALGVGGVFQRDRKKVFAVLGLMISILTVVGLTSVVLLGLAMDG